MAIERIPMGTLYDPMGVVISPSPIPPMAPGMEGVGGIDYGPNDRFRGYLSSSITPGRIAAILRAADQGDPHDLFQVCEEVLEKDAKIASVHNTRVGAIRGLQRDFMPAEVDDATEAEKQAADEIANFCSAAIEKAGLNNLITDGMDAISKPFSIDWIDWGFDRDGRVVPMCFRRIPGTHIRWGIKRDEVRVFDPAVNPTFADGEVGDLLPPRATIRFLSNTRREHPTRAGLLRSVLYLYSFKVVAMKDYAIYIDRYGMPSRVAKLPYDLFNNAEFKSEIRAALKTIGSDGSGVITDNMELEILSAAGKGGPDVFDRMIDIVNREVAQLYLGHELSSQAASGARGGQYGISAAERVRQDILEGDCQWFSEIIKRDLIDPMVEWNFGQDLLYLAPTLWFDFEPPRDLIGEASVDALIAKTFPELEWSEAQIREKYGVDRPIGQENETDDLLLSAGPPPSPGAVTNPDGTPVSPAEAPTGSQPPAQPAAQDPGTVNRPRPVYARKRKRGPRLPRYSPERQRKVDHVAARGIERGMKTLTSFEQQIRSALRGLAAAGVNDIDEIRKRLISVYPTLDTRDFTDTLKKQLMLVRLAGRQGG